MGDSISLNNVEQLQLRDGTGRLLGVFLTPTILEQMNAERERLAKEVAELRKQLDEAQRRVAVLEQDWHSMFRLLPRELQVSEEDIREALQNRIPLEKLIQELEQMGSRLEREMP
jgi:predicted nuclease of restriction endonuclease-like RecB superfamily